MIRTKTEDAVSPVIGVMLMLVVTIIIAAVVAVFASGVGADAEPAPTTVLDVVDIYDAGSSTIPSPGEQVAVTKLYFDESSFINEIAMYYAVNKGDIDFAQSIMYGAIQSGTEVEYNGFNVNCKFGVWHINDKAIVDSDSYVFDNVLNSPEFEKIKSYCTEEQITEDGVFKPVTVTISSEAGDILNLGKLSIKVYDSNGVLAAVKTQNSLSGTLVPGDTLTINLDELLTNPSDPNDFNSVVAYDKVEVFVLYGEHILVSEKMKVRG